ncbi:MAG TPA: FmdB family zinc ribbon protein [Burkholderiaceae bacterium]|jgi:putative FmdB family regulatory protein|nr:FmdB family zinc ribbon protein [Burkholderiaceae bacterium]
MPIYAYRCEACGFAKDVLQKVSDARLTECLSCGKSTFKKQLTAAGFQLKGTGWYATDFRGGAGAAAPAPAATDAPAATAADSPTGTSTAAPAATSSSGGNSSTA